MKITEIDWTVGKRYTDGNGRMWAVKETLFGNTLALEGVSPTTLLDETRTLEAICSMEFEEIEEQKYYLVLKRGYYSNKKYLQQTPGDGGIAISSYKDEKISKKTRFTKKEIAKLYERFGTDILDFDITEVRND